MILKKTQNIRIFVSHLSKKMAVFRQKIEDRQKMQNPPLAITIISGFLGSGKTTLLKRMLSTLPEAKRIAVVENELGDVPIDDIILSEYSPAKIDTVLGRTCCETRGAFVKTMKSLAENSSNYDRVIIESTGVVHPGMLANAILSDQELSEKMRLDGIVTVVDAANFIQHLDGDGHAREQVAFADSIIINKCDLCSFAEVEKLTGLLQTINPTAKYTVATHAQTDISAFLDLGGFDVKKIAQSIGGCFAAASHSSNPHSHKHAIATVAIKTTDTYAFLSLKEWLEEYIAKHRDDIYRAKGILSIANFDKQIVFQGVHDNFYVDVGDDWGDYPRENSMIFIGENLNAQEIKDGLSKCIY